MADRSSRSRSRGRDVGCSALAVEVVWYTYRTPQGHPYYHQPETQQTVWERPSAPNARIMDNTTPPLPMGTPAAGGTTWITYRTADGRPYYHQPETQQTVWERPSGPSDRVIEDPNFAMHQQQMASYMQASMYGQYGAIPGMGMGCGAAMYPYYGATPATMPGSQASATEAFITSNGLDASSANKLRALAPDLQRQVVERGSLTDARNPNAVLMSRIRDAERAKASDPVRRGPPSVEEFIAENRIDASAADKLRLLSPDLQNKIMERGNLTDARNPNAMLMGRIRDAERDAPMSSNP